MKAESVSFSVIESAVLLIAFVPPESSSIPVIKDFNSSPKGRLVTTIPEITAKNITAPETVRILFMEFVKTFENTCENPSSA